MGKTEIIVDGRPKNYVFLNHQNRQQLQWGDLRRPYQICSLLSEAKNIECEPRSQNTGKNRPIYCILLIC